MIKVLPIFLFALLPVCYGGLDQADEALAGMSLSKLQKTSDACYRTSKDRELTSLTTDHASRDACVNGLEGVLSDLKQESEKTVNRLQEQIDYEKVQKQAADEEEAKIRKWLDEKCTLGTSLYCYVHLSNDIAREGYCVLTDGKVTSSFVVGEGPNSVVKLQGHRPNHALQRTEAGGTSFLHP